MYECLAGREAKWLSRYILKDYHAVFLPDSWEMESGKLGMPNVASITLNMFRGPPPVAIILEGTQVLKGQCTPKRKQVGPHPSVQLGENKWPRRSKFRSREASPISQPLTFSRGLLRPEKLIVNLHPGSSPARPRDTAPRNDYAQIDLISDKENSGSPVGSSQTRVEIQSSPNANSKLVVSSGATLVEKMHSSTPEQANSDRSCSLSIIVASKSMFFSSTTLLPTSSAGALASSPTRTALSTISPNVSMTSAPKAISHVSKKLPEQKLLMTGGNGSCHISPRGRSCPLLRCIFILSPCIASSPRLIKELLPWHRCLYTTSLSSLKHPSFPVHCSKTRYRYRKIILINVHNRLQTVEFLREVQNLSLETLATQGKRKRNREEVMVKEWIEVYDWRILEAAAKIDQGKEYDYDVWKRNFIGTV